MEKTNEAMQMYERYALLLESDGISSYKVSQDTGISQTLLSNWKCGKSTPSIHILILLAEYFNVSLDYFVKSSENNAEIGNNEKMFAKLRRALNEFELTDNDIEFIESVFRIHKELK